MKTQLQLLLLLIIIKIIMINNISFYLYRMEVKSKDLNEREKMQHYVLNFWDMKNGISREGT